MSARRAGSVTLLSGKTGLDARNHGVSGAEPTTGPELSERVEHIRAALPDADRTRFEQELDQALDAARSTRRPYCNCRASAPGACARPTCDPCSGTHAERSSGTIERGYVNWIVHLFIYRDIYL